MEPYRESKPDRYCRLFAPSEIKDPDRRDALAALGEAMLDLGGIVSDPDSPEYLADAGYTYFGQFIDHDLTEMAPLRPPIVNNVDEVLENRQSPRLDLSHLYGGGPSDQKSRELYETDGVRLKVGPQGESGRSFDVYVDRKQEKLVLADGRSSENLMIRQMVAVFARLHNAAVEQWRSTISDPAELFEQARMQTVWQFQYLVVEDYLKRMLDRRVFEKIFVEGKPSFNWKTTFSIPVEFAVAGFRFGHSMVRLSYVFSIETDVLDFELHEILERAARRKQTQLEDKWEIRWGCFFQGAGHVNSAGRPDSTLLASRPIDTLIAEPLHNLPDEVIKLFTVAQAPLALNGNKFRLPIRTLLRGESMRLASGKTVADTFGVPRLKTEQLVRERGGPMAPHKPHKPILETGNLLHETPLWYYVLKESEVAYNGSRLGPVGSHIVAETISGALRYHPNSYLFSQHSPGTIEWRARRRLFQPPTWRIGGTECQIHTLSDLFRLAPDLAT